MCSRWAISTPSHTLVRNITILCPLEKIRQHSHQPPPSSYTPLLPLVCCFWKKNAREEKSDGKSAVPGAGGGENLISSGVLQRVGYWGGCNLIRRGNSMDCEQVSSLRPVTFLMLCGGGGGDSRRRDGGGGREGETKWGTQESEAGRTKKGLRERGDGGGGVPWHRQPCLSSMGTERKGEATLILLRSDCVSDGARGTFPGRWPIYIGLITSNLEISPQNPTKPSPFLFQTLTSLSLPFSPCSEFPLSSQSHFLLLWLFLAR